MMDRPWVALGLYQPDMAPNVGAMLRLGACFGAPVHVIEPCGFAFSPQAWRRQAMDYAALAEIHRHASWERFRADRPAGRLIALTTRAEDVLWSVRFQPGDMLLTGQESAGLPEAVHEAVDLRVRIPMQRGARALNVGMAAAVALGEAARQQWADWSG